MGAGSSDPQSESGPPSIAFPVSREGAGRERAGKGAECLGPPKSSCKTKTLATKVAIKKISLAGPRKKELASNEIKIMKRLRGPSVVNYLGSYLVHEEVWLVMEYMDGGTLSDVICAAVMYEEEIAAVSQQCLQGLDFLHSNRVIHRDLKSHNILLRTDGSVKLGEYILGQVQHSRDVRCGAAFE
ncbi:serine/threonine-protein kinase PAK 3-like [Prinia subflava]|uniref:serine/threonine-protein kinase PAK 3-like n=1 Tax=Prinia subflava TaxID=208062 RepID=UPI002FE251AB